MNRSKFRWQANTNQEWLQARRGVLTATDVRNLLTTVRKYNRSTKEYERNDRAFERMQEGDYDAKWLALYGEKSATGYIDEVSSGAMARGHMLEPYAIAQFNADGIAKETFYHWDDCLLRNADMFLGFSPDAMTIEQPANCPVIIDTDKDTQPYEILEIKCYGAGHHTQCICADKADLDERWQIACAMATDYAISGGYVYFFNPNVPVYGEAYYYSRKELQEEIELIWDMANAFSSMSDKMPNRVMGKLLMDEDEIIGDLIAKRNEEASKLENLIKASEV